MNKKYDIPWKSIFVETLLITILTIVLSYFCAPILQFFSPQRYFQQSPEDNEFTSSYFQHVYSTIHENDFETSNITIVNIGYLTKRDDIANILYKIDSMAPLKIGVDILFRDYNHTKEDSILRSVVNTIKKKSVFVCGIDNANDQVVHSFFCDPRKTELYVDSVSEGLSELLLDNDKKTITNFRYKDVIGGDTLLTFAARTAMDYYNVLDVDHDDHIINYKKLKFNIIDYDSLREDYIRGRIVLVGNINDGQDQHGSPIGVLSGLEVHAQITNMIYEGEGIDKIGWFGEFIFSTIPLFFFIFFLVVSDYLGEHFRTKKSEILSSLLQEIGCLPFFLSVVFVIISGTISYWIYTEYGKMVNMNSALIGVTILALFSKSVVHFLIIIYNNKKKK